MSVLGALTRGLGLFSSPSRLYSSRARDILNKGFQRMQDDKTYKKSPSDLQQLVEAGRELGVSERLVREVYSGVEPGSKSSKGKLSAQERVLIAEHDMELFGTPTPANFGRPFGFDDLPSAGHLQLEEHRSQRQYVRWAAWDLPQLTQYATKYRRPSKTENLRFQHSVFLGEEHPEARKVVMSFSPESTGLTGPALHKLKLLAGPRYDAEKNEIKMASQRFAEQAQNKRFLSLVYRRLVDAAKDTSETFADIPLDQRPALGRQRRRRPLYPEHDFPQAWNRPDMAPKRPEDALSVLSNLSPRRFDI